MSIFRKSLKSFKSDGKKQELFFHKSCYGYSVKDCKGFTPRYLRMRILYAENLTKKRLININCFYCKIAIYRSIRSETLIGEKFETKAYVTKSDPTWYEEMILRVDNELNRIVIDIHDKLMMKNSVIGTVTIHLQDIKLQVENGEKTIPLYRFNLISRGKATNNLGSLVAYLALLKKDYNNKMTNIASKEKKPSIIRDMMGCPNISEKIVPAAIVMEEDFILPEGWEKRVDYIGRMFYANVNKRMTQWEKPTLELNEGWEKKFDNKGRAFYINHITKTTQWEHPNSGVVLRRPGKKKSTKKSKAPPHVDNSSRLQVDADNDDITDTDSNSNLMSIRHSLRMAPSFTNIPNQQRSRESYREEFPESHFRQRLHINDVDNIEDVTIEGTRFQHRRITMNIEEKEEKEKHEEDCKSDDEDLEKQPLPDKWETAISEKGRRFFINHDLQITTWADPRKSKRSTSIFPKGSIFNAMITEHLLDELGPLGPEWEEKEMPNGSVFYLNHKTKTTQWDDPRIGKMAKRSSKFVPDIAFKQKFEYFRRKLVRFKDPKAKLEIKVNRNNLFQDTQQAINMVRKTEYLKAKLWIEFIGEKGLDYGGVSREFFYLLSKEMFDPAKGYFQYSSLQTYTLQINPNSAKMNKNHLSGFKSIGMLMGMAIFHGRLLDAYFIRPFYKMMMCKKISITDMEISEPEYYNSLRYIINYDPEDLDLTFSVDDEQDGVVKEIDLIPNGRNIIVTESNKKIYIASIIRWRFVTRIEEQMLAFMDGFTQLIPIDKLQIFSANELELLISGLQEINIADWQKYTVYKKGYTKNHPVIVNFWKVVYSFNTSMRSRLLQFSTGTSRVPMNGFSQLIGSSGPTRFTLEKWGGTQQLPRAHTCFNRIDLPPYESYDVLRQKLIVAILHSEGFEGVD